MRFFLTGSLLLVVAISTSQVYAQKKKPEKTLAAPSKEASNAAILNGLKFRSVGPALTSGRIADLAINPLNHNEYYVAAAAGGVWKTTNAGITYTPVFDNEGSYSIGCVVLDPSNPNIVWVAQGESNNQRGVVCGEGV